MEQQNTPQTQLMSVKDWVITIILTGIPLVGLILLFVWAFGNDGNQTRSNYAKGMLIAGLIMTVLYFFLIFSIFGLAFLGSTSFSQ